MITACIMITQLSLKFEAYMYNDFNIYLAFAKVYARTTLIIVTATSHWPKVLVGASVSVAFGILSCKMSIEWKWVLNENEELKEEANKNAESNGWMVVQI